jgi:hypothetical protein
MAYPMIFEVDNHGQGCMDLYLPDSDDAHLVFIPLPEEMETELEDWFISEVAEIARPSSTQFLKDLSPMPNHVAQGIKKYKNRSKVTVSIERDGIPTVYNHLSMTYFLPFVVKDIVHTSVGKSRDEKEDWDESAGTYRFCVHVRGNDDVHVVFDVVKISEYQQLMDKKHIVRKEHLTPLERAFEESANLAKTIIDEMHYMEKREARMKQTSDRTNGRIKWFSYLSISILLGVTYVQAKYLKGYFKKKKIL